MKKQIFKPITQHAMQTQYKQIKELHVFKYEMDIRTENL